MELVPEGVWPAVVVAAEYKVSQAGMRYVQLRLRFTERYIDAYVNLVPKVRWMYEKQLRRLGVDLQLYFEWDGVDLTEHMAEALTFVLPDTGCYVWVQHVEWRGELRARAQLV